MAKDTVDKRRVAVCFRKRQKEQYSKNAGFLERKCRDFPGEETRLELSSAFISFTGAVEAKILMGNSNASTMQTKVHISVSGSALK